MAPVPVGRRYERLRPLMQQTVIIGTLVMLMMVGFIVLLVLLNQSRRLRHQAALAELRQQQQRAVMEAEKEAATHTMREIGRELHDNVAQLLGVAQMGLNNELDDGRSNTRLESARDALEQGLDEVRRLGHQLNSDLWQHRSLEEAISAEAERLERVARIKVHLQMKPLPLPLTPDTRVVLFRIFQVLVNNALKHSGTDVVSIELVPAKPKGVVIRITDRGRGFDQGTAQQNAGIPTVHKRCASIGYRATCTTAPGAGCSWTIEPLPDHGT